MKNEVAGHWHEMVGEAKKKWGKLTDDDFLECEGNMDKLIGKLQSLYGLSSEEARSRVSAMERSIREARKGGERLYGGDAPDTLAAERESQRGSHDPLVRAIEADQQKAVKERM